MKNKIIFFRNLGLSDWLDTFNKMNDFTTSRGFNTFDEIWFVEHYPIFTQGYLKKKENIKFIHNIQLVNSNRGGRITYHGPGQQILYFLIDLKRRKINIRQFIEMIQKIVIEILRDFSIQAHVKKTSPGVYVDEKKICSLGLRIKKGCTLHGLALNVNMDLRPFNYINPCGDTNIKMTQIKDFNLYIRLEKIRLIFIEKLSKFFNVRMINSTYNLN